VKTFVCAHTGRSMNPTLDETDLLEVVPAGDTPPVPGDVLLFRPAGWKEDVVHRATSVSAGGIRSRGDNCDERDPWILQAEDVSGRVVAAWRGRKRRSVAGGRRGLLTAALARVRRALRRAFFLPLRGFYLACSRGAPAAFLLPPGFRPKVVHFRTGGRALERVLIGRRVVGLYDEKRGQWHIRRPWRLFVDCDALP
jgi:hypothetical protein